MIMTDPPYELAGEELASILARFDAQHLVLITTMRQLLAFMRSAPWELAFDFVLDAVMPKRSRSHMQPNYTHQTGVYLTMPGVKSAFDRRKAQRRDVFEQNGYWPTLFHAPRENVSEHGHAKNVDAITGLLSSFTVDDVCDPFAGLGSTGLAAAELSIPCTMIERDPETCEQVRKTFRFMGLPIEVMP